LASSYCFAFAFVFLPSVRKKGRGQKRERQYSTLRFISLSFPLSPFLVLSLPVRASRTVGAPFFLFFVCVCFFLPVFFFFLRCTVSTRRVTNPHRFFCWSLLFFFTSVFVCFQLFRSCTPFRIQIPVHWKASKERKDVKNKRRGYRQTGTPLHLSLSVPLPRLSCHHWRHKKKRGREQCSGICCVCAASAFIAVSPAYKELHVIDSPSFSPFIRFSGMCSQECDRDIRRSRVFL
jgi:hypothetical protein